VSSNNGTLFIIKSGQLLFKKECDVQAKNKKQQKQYIVLLFTIPIKTESNVRRCGKLVNQRVTTGT
jgi:hypothetical protein